MLSDEEFGSLGFTFIWRIENFGYCLEKENDYICSPRFVMNSRGLPGYQTGWHLEMYPRKVYQQDHLISYILRKDASFGMDCITLNYELSILAADGSLQESIEEEQCKFHNGFFAKQAETKYVSHAMLQQKKNQYLPQNTLTLYCCMWEPGNVFQWLGQSSARTRIGIEKTSIIWPIDTFKNLRLNEKRTLNVPNLQEELSLILYFEYGMVYDTNIRIKIVQPNSSQQNLTSCKISVVNSKGLLAYSMEDTHWFEKKEDIQVWNFPLFIQKSSLLTDENLYLPDNTLRLQCDFAISIGVVYSILEHSELGPFETPHVNNFVRNFPKKPNVAKLSNFMQADLRSLYGDKTLCDFTIIVRSESFSAHKAILASRSSVFHAMITNDMLEKKASQVAIPDMDSDTVKRMLLYMYTDTIEDRQWEHVSKLYSAADKYGIQSLKQECSSFMESNLSVENVSETLELSDMHQDNSLKDAAVKFIFRNDDKILLSDEWKKLMKRKSQLVAEIISSMYLMKIGNPGKSTS